MLVGGIHWSLDEPPSSTMFLQAGKGTSSKKKEDSSSMADAFTKVAVAISSILTAGPSDPAHLHHQSGSQDQGLLESEKHAQL